MKTKSVGSMNNFFATLTWDDVEVWAGAKVAARGQEYFRRGLVKKIAFTSFWKGGII